MRFKDTVVITEYRDGYALAAIGRAGESYKGIMKINATAAFVCELLKANTTEEEIVNKILEKYSGVSKEQAENNVKALIQKLDGLGIIDRN